MNSFSRGMPGEIFELGQYQIAFGTNVEYAATQNFGANRGEFGSGLVSIPRHARETKSGTVYVRGHQRIMHFPWGDIPALNFLKLMPEDVDDFEELADELVMSGGGA
jgi:phage gpG-like protein